MSIATADRPRIRWLVVGLCSAVLILLSAIAWVGVRAYLAKSTLGEVVPHLTALQQSAADGDVHALTATVDTAADPIARAAHLTSDPLWRALEPLPFLGDDLRAARVSTDAADALVVTLARPVLHELSAMDSSNGASLDPAMLTRVSGYAADAAGALERDRDELRGLDASALLPPLRTGVDRIRPLVEQITPAVRQAARVTDVAAGLSGAQGPRTVLVAIQNNAELRTGGGITGAFVSLHIENGRIRLDRIASDGEFAQPTHPVTPVPAATTALYGDAVGTHVQNTTMSADFAVTGRLASAWWHDRTGATPDAVAAIDPTVLAAVLEATGPVTLPDGTKLTAHNAVHTLLVDAYLTRAPEDQDAFFADAAAAVFDRLESGPVDVPVLVRALSGPVEQGRISLWSADASQQRELARTVFGGPSARHALAGPGAFAVYFNDATAAKMDSFLDITLGVGHAPCRADGRHDVVVSVRMANTAPPDAGRTLPGVMTGWGLGGVPEGDIATAVTVAAPNGAFIGGVHRDDRLIGARTATDDGLPMVATTVRLSPGEETTLHFRFILPADATAAPTVLHTPTLGDLTVDTAPVTCG